MTQRWNFRMPPLAFDSVCAFLFHEDDTHRKQEVRPQKDTMKTKISNISLPQTVIKLGWVSFFTDVASEMLYPVVPLFLTTALGAPVVVLGIIEGVAEAIVSLMKGLSGWHCDRIGRRVPYIRWGYGLAALSKPLMALAFSWPLVFLARSIDRFGKGLRTTARDTLIADTVEASRGGKAYGFHRMMDTSGAIIGVLCSMGLLALLPGRYRTIFLIATIPGIAAVWLTFGLKERHTRNRLDTTAGACIPRQKRALPKLSKGYWITLGLLGIFAFANSSDTFLILRAKNLGLSDLQTIFAYTLFNAVYALSSYPLGLLSDRFGRWRMVVSGWMLYSIVYFGFAFSGMSAVWLLFPFYGLFMGLTEGIGKALIRDNIDEAHKGTAMGIFHMSLGFSSLAGSIVAGLLWDSISPKAPFILGGSIALLAVLLFLLSRRLIMRTAKPAPSP
ncbi:MFS transporter [Solidesulfovibrio fructosivorans]|nr:MFS transporter [Solidesulfovibrio fructosivorans]